MKLKTLSTFCLLFLLSFIGKASRDPLHPVLTTENFKKGVVLDSCWVYNLNDSSSFSSKDYNDSHWRFTIADSTDKDTALAKHKGITWFRTSFTVDSSAQGLSVSLDFLPSAAVEIFLDGEKITTLGTVSENKKDYKSGFTLKGHYVPLNLLPGNHILAIRTAQFGLLDRIGILDFNNEIVNLFTYKLTPTSEAIEDSGDFDQLALFLSFAVVFLVLTVFHMILFIYYRKNLTNLYYSMFTLLLFIIFFGLYKMFQGVDMETTVLIGKTQSYLAFFVPLFFIGILYQVFYKKLQVMFWVLVGMLVLAYVLIFLLDMGNIGALCVLAFLFVGMIETIRVFIKAAMNKKDGANIFLFGTFFPLLGTIALVFVSIISKKAGFARLHQIIDDHYGEFFGYSILLSASFSMTLYLARDFARMNKNLLKQIKENKQLFDRTIEQEQERKRILENQNEELERKVVQRTEQVVSQKAEIESKNRDILDNLHYARRIQEAILPEIKLIYKTLQESFIIYFPKDIVSGDFYAFSQKNGKVIIAAADCTGHGVTGAFMSMIGTALLNQIINEHGIVQPAKALEELHTGIAEALKQNHNDTELRDGMDIALCSMDLEKLELTYAGANRPLWIVRNGELIVVKPDKTAIGGFHANRHVTFTDHVIQLQKGDTFYIFTDGYADQFGGPNGKKFMSGQFKKLLTEIQSLPMRQQEEHIKDKFHQWQGSLPQLDDVLVIGVRV